MSQAQFSEDETQTMTLEVQWGGRTFSPSPDTPSPSPQGRIRQLQQRREEIELPKLLHEAILARLSWIAVPPEETERQPLVEAYIASLSQLERLRGDVEELVRAACLANLEFRQLQGETNVNGRDAALASKLDEMLVEAACDWLPTRNVLDAKLVSQPVSTLRRDLQAAITDAVAVFTTQFFELLAKLVERQLFGLVEWLPNHCCGYHFFKRVIIQENLGTSEFQVAGSQYYEPESVKPGPKTGRRIVGKRTIKETRHGQHYHRFARHEHSVMNAVCTTIRNSQVVMPPQVARLVGQVPDWLYPFVQVIDGDIFRERVIEQDTGVETWTDVHVHDEPIYGHEPGVIIGPYVLTGWGPREVGQEQARRETVEKTAIAQTARRRAPWFVAASVVMTLVALLLLIQLLRGGGGGLFVVLATIAAIGAAWQATFDFATARRNPTAALAAHFSAATMAFQILLGYWLVARWFQPMSWVTPVALGLAAIVSYAIGRRFR
jgi:hypothetical protein